jgi:hypothetical protein
VRLITLGAPLALATSMVGVAPAAVGVDRGRFATASIHALKPPIDFSGAHR